MSKSSFRDLIAWQKAMQLAVAVYSASKLFPPHERFGLAQQIRRAAVSVPSNIAEGRGRGSAREYRQFLLAARGSTFEVQTQALLAIDLGYPDETSIEEIVARCEEVIRLINGLIRYLDNRLK